MYHRIGIRVVEDVRVPRSLGSRELRHERVRGELRRCPVSGVVVKKSGGARSRRTGTACPAPTGGGALMSRRATGRASRTASDPGRGAPPPARVGHKEVVRTLVIHDERGGSAAPRVRDLLNRPA